MELSDLAMMTTAGGLPIVTGSNRGSTERTKEEKSCVREE